MPFYLLSLCLFLSGIQQSYAFTLEQKWDYEKVNPSMLQNSDLLKGVHVLFVAGIMNELASLISSYYSDNMESVQALGATVSYFGPASQNAIPENADILYKKIVSLSYQTQKKLIVVGHSKGGAELFYTILKHPDLFSRHLVDRVILIQAAIGGSPLATSTCGWCRDLISTVVASNLETLTVYEGKNNFNIAFGLFNNALKRISKSDNPENILLLKSAISKRIFYVRSQQEQNNLSFVFKFFLGICRNNLNEYGKNDGLLLVDAQMDPRLGIDLGILKADHIGLTVSTVSNMTRHDRQAFTRALFHHVLEHKTGELQPNDIENFVPYLGTFPDLPQDEYRLRRHQY